MKGFKLTYFIAISLLVLLFSCNSTKLVPEGHYLLDKNTIDFTDEKLPLDEINTIIRQQPNRTTLGVKLNLYIYNSIDSVKVVKSRSKQYAKVVAKNKKHLARQKRINERRIEKARSRGDSTYTQRIIPLKDTINLRLSLREWVKYKRGEKPVIFDSLLMHKSAVQLNKYLITKGYYYGSVSASYSDNPKNPKKRSVTYTINSGKPYYIDSFYVECSNSKVLNEYKQYLKEQLFNPLLGEKFDENYLDEHRSKVAKHMRDHALYGFSPSNISYVADTNNMKLTLKVIISDRQLIKDDSVIYVKYKDTYVQDVYFHILDTTYYKGSFKEDLEKDGISLTDGKYLRTLDSLAYQKILYTKREKRERDIPLEKDSLNPWRFAYILYNGKPALKPAMLELQNYLENQNTYKEYYIDRSYNRLMQLDVFQTIKPVVKEIEGTNKVEVHYYLVPAKKQSFSIEERFNNSNGFLGLAASLNYNNKNLFRGSEKLTISFGGGFESQPPVFDETVDGKKIKQAGRSFNTFEIGPSVKFDLPGLLLVRKATKLSKRHRPRTILSSAYNFQQRNDFSRAIFQLNFLWKFYMVKTQVVQIGFPAAAVKFVRIDPTPAFKERLDLSNDLFLKNAYSNQFVWENLKVLYEFNNKNSDNKKKADFVLNSSFVSAGWLLSLMNLKDTSATGQKEVFGVAYSQFVRFDNNVIYGYPINKKTSFHARGSFGVGIPRGNKTTSLPYDYSFFAGGSNDNRGWRARALGPGSYKYYLDQERTATQIGDIRIAASGELRYNITSTFKTALFVDAGNIWTYKKDEKRIGGQFSNDFYKEIALSAGLGLRLDFTFLIARLDLGFPITNPALPQGAKWVFQSRDPYIQEGIDKWGVNNYSKYLPKAFRPVLQFGIGYPF